ncbi:MAG: class I SAM-dependent rRNA methyltransferase [Deltaproteobacteria bacterium]|nr:class I SAM-dependent rRNA methyltransferase [Deltaproteobacteria bacterium]
MSQPPRNVKLVLGSRAARAVRAGHPWVWKDGLDRPPAELSPAGTVVELVDRHGAFVARGLYDPGSPIAVRVYSRTAAEALDEAWIAARVVDAARRRETMFDAAATEAYRLVHGEADGLPGVVCDRYGAVVVVRFDGAAAATLAAPVERALLGLPGIQRVFERRDRRGEREEPGPRDATTAGEPEATRVRVSEQGLYYEADLERGHKTGLYLDQRENRARVRELARGKRVLNLYAYTGGFSVAAAAGGARATLSVDLSTPAIAAAERNLALNGFGPPAHRVLVADVRKLLRAGLPEGGAWDLVVLDPPSFAPRQALVPRALEAYRMLNRAVLARLEPGALLLTCSCSSHVNRATFVTTVGEAARAAGVAVRRLWVHGAGADHPVLPAFPEGDYLKAVLLEVAGPRASASRPRARGRSGARGAPHDGSRAPPRGRRSSAAKSRST